MAAPNQSTSHHIDSDYGIIAYIPLEDSLIMPWVEQIDEGLFMLLGDHGADLAGIPSHEWIDSHVIWESLIGRVKSSALIEQRREPRASEMPSVIEFQFQTQNRQTVNVTVSESIVNQGGVKAALGFLKLTPIASLSDVDEVLSPVRPSVNGSTPFPTVPAIDHLPGTVFTRAADDNWTVEYLSAGCFDLTGFPAAELTDVPPLLFNSLIHEEDYAAIVTLLDSVRENPQAYAVEYRINPRNSDLIWVLEKGCPILDNEGTFVGFEGLITDITETKRAQEQLQYDAFYDTLTTLPNRSLFLDRLERLLKRTKRRADYCFAVFFLDLDRFKTVNDSLGHRAGDTLLINVGERLQACLRPGDTVARLGGDEFTMLIDDIQDSSDVAQVSDRILEAMKLPFTLEGRDIYTSISIGISLSSIGYTQPDEMLRDADIALYQAKALGKARSAIFNPGMHIQAVAQSQLENGIKHAIKNRELRLYYQPIVSLETGLVEGLEVFVYWQHPDRGLIGPTEFIPVAEEQSIMSDIGAWVMREAAQQVKIWHQTFPSDPPLFISINLTPSEALNPNFLPTLQTILQQTQLEAGCVKIEISEKVFLDDPEALVQRLEELKGMGVKICIDDFGTEYSALSYINQFPVDVVKIDRSFISHLDQRENLEIVRSLLTLSKTLDFQVVAEGVENVTQLAQLRALGCEWGQGYCLARPLEGRLVETCLLQEPTGELTSSVSVALPRLLVHTKTGQYHLLLVGRTSWTIGRGQDSSIFLSDRMVSREHAILLQLARTSDFFFVDLGSRNGSFLNGNSIDIPVLLKEGDRIRIGKTELEYRQQTAATKTDWTEFPYKTVLMHQTHNLQGEIWREILLTQGISIIWHTDDSDLFEMLEQLEASGDTSPDLLLLELTALRPEPAFVLNQLQKQYPQLKIILTSGRSPEVSMEQQQWARQHHAIAIIPGFNLRGNDLSSNSHDIALKARQLLDEIECHPDDEELREAALVALQVVIRNETLY